VLRGQRLVGLWQVLTGIWLIYLTYGTVGVERSVKFRLNRWLRCFWCRKHLLIAWRPKHVLQHLAFAGEVSLPSLVLREHSSPGSGEKRRLRLSILLARLLSRLFLRSM
jgi:hypothetical protein